MTVVSTVRQPPFPGSFPDRKDILPPGYSYKPPAVPPQPAQQPQNTKPE